VGQRLGENGALIVPTALDLDVFLGKREAAALAEVGDCGSLSVDPESVGTLAAFRGDPEIRDDSSFLQFARRLIRDAAGNQFARRFALRLPSRQPRWQLWTCAQSSVRWGPGDFQSKTTSLSVKWLGCILPGSR
jgi:hypothetical protein